MIECELVLMPEGDDTKLRAWLGKGEIALLIKVATAQENFYQAKAMQEALQAKDHPNYTEAAGLSLRSANRYSTFLEVLKQISTQNERYTLSHLK